MYYPVEVRYMSSLPVTDISGVAKARRAATALADRLGFSEAGVGNVTLVVTEAATNLIKHATAGEILLYALRSGQIGGIEVRALDRGPGMTNVAKCLHDGYSTSGSLGIGLGAIRRLSTSFDIHSAPGAGTVQLARLWSEPLPASRPPFLRVGAVSLPKPGEDVC